VERAIALLLLERHQPYRLLFVLRIVRCSSCRARWPCPTYVDSRSALLGPDRPDVLTALGLDEPEDLKDQDR
jgi:hypothetical protein